MKHYDCGNPECDAPDWFCQFCAHCKDLFWDYEHGPYILIRKDSNVKKDGEE